MVISWQRAVSLFFRGKVEVVHEYDSEVRSVSLVLKIPSVVRLTRYISFRRNRPPLTKLNLLARDGFTCQYCKCELNFHTASIDHVVPRSQGGGNLWTNLVCACHECNRKKGGRTPEQANMPLQYSPFEPNWLPVLAIRSRRTIPEPWEVFLK